MAGNLTAMIASIFSGSAVSTDPYFNLTTLLLSTTATNGQQNNTFQDSSTNNFTIARNPATGPNAPTQGTFSPFSQTGWGNYFDGTGDYLSGTTNLWATTTSTFTVDGWIYPTSVPNAKNMLLGDFSATGATLYIGVYINNSSRLVMEWYDGLTKTCTSTSTINLNEWSYVAVRVSSNSISMYVNSATASGLTGTTTLTNRTGTANWSIGQNNNANNWNGYISNIRMSTVARTIVIPTAPFTSDANTKLLTCQSNRFVDTSSNAYAVTPSGNTSVVPFSPFNPTSAWSASTVGGSGYFVNASSNYLSSTITVSNFFTALGDFTFEGWVYPLSFSGPQYSMPLFAFSGDDLMLRAMPTSAASTTLNIYGITSAGAPAFGSPGTSGGTIRINEWAWVVFTRESGVINLWINGTRVVNNSLYTSNQLRQTATVIRLGGAFVGTAPFLSGYLSGLKWTSGAALYSGATISMPTAPPTTTVSAGTTALLLNFTNAGIYDATAKNVLETVGNAQVSNTTSQWPSTSMSFNGTTDYLQVNTASDLYNLSSGNWTIEAWVYRTSTANNKSGIITYLDGTAGVPNGWAFDCGGSNAGQLGFYGYSGSAITTNISSGVGAVPIYTWTYVAATCAGTTITLYINGASVASGTRGTIANNANCRLRIGGWNAPSFPRYWQGYIQDPRITKGYARTITTPTAAFPVQ